MLYYYAILVLSIYSAALWRPLSLGSMVLRWPELQLFNLSTLVTFLHNYLWLHLASKGLSETSQMFLASGYNKLWSHSAVKVSF